MKQQEIDNQVAILKEASRAELLARWTELYGKPPPPRCSIIVLRGNLIYDTQAKIHGGLSSATKQKLERYYKKFKQNPNYCPKNYNAPDIRPGTKLLREWHGEIYEVLVSDQGYVYGGKLYKSLSAIARYITGSSWSGKKFFGIKRS
jgi:hypothetical protein